MVMAEVVGRKLVENDQERILQRIFDGVNSNFVLDISDFKESHEHKLLHLVWRKFPRNYRPPTDGQKTIISNSTQTDVESRAGRHKISENSIIPDVTNCRSATEKGPFDIRETSDLDKSLRTFDFGFGIC